MEEQSAPIQISPRKHRVSLLFGLFAFFLLSIGIGILVTLQQNKTQDTRSRASTIAETSQNATATSDRVFIFSIEQAWGNSLIEKQDFVSLNRIITSLKPFQQKYHIFVLLTPMNSDKSKIFAVLDRLKTANIPFILDVHTSDGLTLGSNSTFNKPFDPAHGIIRSAVSPSQLSELKEYKNRYPSHFAAMRIMEAFSLDFTVRTCKTTNPTWCLPHWILPSDAYYQQRNVKQYLDFAKQNNMFVFWTDFHWYQFHPSDTTQQKYESDLITLLQGTTTDPTPYKNVLFLSYSNNEHKNKEQWVANNTWFRLRDWEQSVKTIAKGKTKGFGISDQSWACSNELICPPLEIVRWANDAFAKGARIVQLEPSWYFWKLPRGIRVQTADYTKDPEWVERGCPTANLIALKQAFGIPISSTLGPSPASGEAACNTYYPETLSPPTISATCNDNGTATIAWAPVPNASFYKLRVDDTSNSFNSAICSTSTSAPASPNQFDRCINSYTSTSYTISPTHRDATYKIWAHAVINGQQTGASTFVRLQCRTGI